MSLRVALAHDYLAVQGGAERVVASLVRTFPGAPVHTSVYRPEALFTELSDPLLDVRPSPLNRFSVLRNNYRLTLPFLPHAMESMHIDADVVVCSSSGWAHGVSTTGKKLVYCHNPARWLYQRDVYLSLHKPAWWAAAISMRQWLLRWDQRQAHTCAKYLANSSVVARRIEQAYGIEAEVLPPPTSLDAHGPRESMGFEPGYALTVGRLLGYKHVDAIIETFRNQPKRRLLVVGDGPARAALAKFLPPNVELLGRTTDPQLRWLYANASCLVAASEEDFGLTPVEAAMFGTPSVLLRYGGFLDSMVEGETAVYFDQPTASSIGEALNDFDGIAWDRDAVRARGAMFSEERFAKRLRDEVRLLAGVAHSDNRLDHLRHERLTPSVVA